MASMLEAAAADVDHHSVALCGSDHDYDDLLALVGRKRFVLLGEATHGTHDFYRERARITKRLIEEKGFTAVAVEADWPDAYRVNRYVLGQSDDIDADTALSDFRRFPAWMWRNHDVVSFIEWLRARNDAHGQHQTKTRFYGLDLYSLRASMEAVVAYLDRVDPAAAAEARARYSCFDHVQGEGPEYGHAVALDITVPCEQEVVAELMDLRERAVRLLSRDGWVAEDEFFFAEQNARLVRNAERYYRAMYHGRVASWNLRDRHMDQTLDALATHLDR
ncbi:MAG TPA: erythromycin esterase family protein, partial [Acidimicrobiales bacterium]|nr:erythromycin esterase family protein [Acidimicrobiales bacterium]